MNTRCSVLEILYFIYVSWKRNSFVICHFSFPTYLLGIASVHQCRKNVPDRVKLTLNLLINYSLHLIHLFVLLTVEVP
jgi:hypothetical protein